MNIYPLSQENPVSQENPLSKTFLIFTLLFILKKKEMTDYKKEFFSSMQNMLDSLSDSINKNDGHGVLYFDRMPSEPYLNILHQKLNEQGFRYTARIERDHAISFVAFNLHQELLYIFSKLGKSGQLTYSLDIPYPKGYIEEMIKIIKVNDCTVQYDRTDRNLHTLQIDINFTT